jgi:hypothetical protein
MKDSAGLPGSYPVSVMMERRLARSGPWSEYQWECVDVIAGEQVQDADGGWTLSSDDGDRARYMWSGLRVELHKDACESYWYSLQSETPYLFVICFHDEVPEDDSMAIQPFVVSPNQDEANSHMESEDLVYSVPMPDTLIDWMERFVVDNYQPVIKKKRKRRNWAEESEVNAQARRPNNLH